MRVFSIIEITEMVRIYRKQADFMKVMLLERKVLVKVMTYFITKSSKNESLS